MPIYTRHGDDGKTMLLDGQRVWKDDPRVQVCGALDELCSWLGVASAYMPVERPELVMQLREAQNELFAIGAVAQVPGRMNQHSGLRLAGGRERARMEGWIDAMETELPPLDVFIAPGGCPAAAFAHVARVVCRRTEGAMVTLARDAEPTAAATLNAAVAYLNRLSDFLFVLARVCNYAAGVEEQALGKSEDGFAG